MKIRPVLLTALVIICFLAVAWGRQTFGNSPVKGEKADSHNLKNTWEVAGWGVDREEAVDAAVTKATDLTWKFLREQDPAFVWKPSADYVRKNLLKGEPVAKPEADYVPPDPAGKEGKRYCWVVTMQISPASHEAMKRENAQLIQTQKQAARLTVFAKFFGLVLAACLLVLGYLRLEEKTKGYFSRLLLFGAIGALIMIGVALFLLL